MRFTLLFIFYKLIMHIYRLHPYPLLNFSFTKQNHATLDTIENVTLQK